MEISRLDCRQEPRARRSCALRRDYKSEHKERARALRLSARTERNKTRSLKPGGSGGTMISNVSSNGCAVARDFPCVTTPNSRNSRGLTHRVCTDGHVPFTLQLRPGRICASTQISIGIPAPDRSTGVCIIGFYPDVERVRANRAPGSRAARRAARRSRSNYSFLAAFD